jgi:hypothetical protein
MLAQQTQEWCIISASGTNVSSSLPLHIQSSYTHGGMRILLHRRTEETGALSPRLHLHLTWLCPEGNEEVNSCSTACRNLIHERAGKAGVSFFMSSNSEQSLFEDIKRGIAINILCGVMLLVEKFTWCDFNIVCSTKKWPENIYSLFVSRRDFLSTPEYSEYAF